MDMPIDPSRRAALGLGAAALATSMINGAGRAAAAPADSCAVAMIQGGKALTAIRVFTGDDGHSHFEEIVLPGEEIQNFHLANDIHITSGFRTFMKRKAIAITILSGPPNLDLPAHNAPTDKKEFFFMIQGSNQLITNTGSRWITPGMIVFFEDATGSGHSGKVGPDGYAVINVQLAD